ncbi:hypothetical protein K488DRAFT_81557 [Vararia minispora EC-137]|uniref:Uncharacterized protein n=1 Tax=Vararia minispora EC-137 TaxID=1314806 RepID=A0ACB8QZH3_9AGAM|nr:hypothetical protein K488DRAFT_81557 [Vararia minispora EC-137]
MSLDSLPIELLLECVELAVAVHPSPACIVAVNKRYYALAYNLLYAHPHIRSGRAILLFLRTPPVPPRSLSVTLAGGEVGSGQFRALAELFRRCVSRRDGAGKLMPTPFEMDELRLCMNITTRADADDTTLEALKLVNPRKLSWTGPDPPHHFSVAIVPAACTNLFARAARWTQLRSLHLANIAFPPPQELFAFPALRALEELYIGQATFFPVPALAVLVCTQDMGVLRSVRLVDCYVESIWGGRVRRGLIERVAAIWWETDGVDYAKCAREAGERVRRVRETVMCEARTERIEGGDRVADGMLILE